MSSNTESCSTAALYHYCASPYPYLYHFPSLPCLYSLLSPLFSSIYPPLLLGTYLSSSPVLFYRCQGPALRVQWDKFRAQPSFLSRWNPWAEDLPYIILTQHPGATNHKVFVQQTEVTNQKHSTPTPGAATEKDLAQQQGVTDQANFRQPLKAATNEKHSEVIEEASHKDLSQYPTPCRQANSVQSTDDTTDAITLRGNTKFSGATKHRELEEMCSVEQFMEHLVESVKCAHKLSPLPGRANGLLVLHRSVNMDTSLGLLSLLNNSIQLGYAKSRAGFGF
ncbi:uncharacterized protein LOC128644600 [Bombina bombina]|uniref:uncharacterized protein LOC128644600 n=1 Tax=Bombina bombina TaxID=8345 RepID=UPI00235B0DCD|nr:uncharacterized protein LOC128644600 [Bombina bombina]